MQSVKTTWEWSLESEAKRIIHCAHQIVAGFFRVNNFFVVPAPLRSNLCGAKVRPCVAAVPFPDLPYQTIPRFWDKVKRVDIRNFPLKFDPDLVSGVTGLLKGPTLPYGKVGPLEEPKMEKVKSAWKKVGGKILVAIEKILDNTGLPRDVPDGTSLAMTRISEIIIHPTRFGTTVSFSVAKSFPTTVEMYLREDRDIYSITEAILSAITRNEVYQDLDGLWSESELLVDWLLMKSSLSPILKKYQPKSNFMPTVKYTRMKQSARLMKKSEEFYRRLGAPVLENFFGLKDGQPTIAGREMENVSAREREILAIMIKKSNTVVTIDEIADLLFTSDEEFSLAAIAKTIQRLRDKLEQNGVSGSFIQTLRGQGYVLKN